MDISMVENGGELTVKLTGRLDTMTAPELDAKLEGPKETADSLIFDMTDLEYVSSAGLRSLLSAQKAMNKKGGKMVVRNASEEVNEVFEVTGFSDILTIE